MWFCLWAWEDRTEIRLEPISWRRFQIADDADGNLHCLRGGRALKCRLGHLQTAGGTSAQALLLWDMLMKLCYIPYYLLAAFMVLAGFADVYVWQESAIIGVMVDCGCLLFDTAVHLRTVRLHPGVQ